MDRHAGLQQPDPGERSCPPRGKRITNGDEIELYDYLIKVYLDADLSSHVVEDPRLSTEELAKVKQFPLPAGSVVKRHFDSVTLTTGQLDLVAKLGMEISGVRDLHELIEIALRADARLFQRPGRLDRDSAQDRGRAGSARRAAAQRTDLRKQRVHRAAAVSLRRDGTSTSACARSAMIRSSARRSAYRCW